MTRSDMPASLQSLPRTPLPSSVAQRAGHTPGVSFRPSARLGIVLGRRREFSGLSAISRGLLGAGVLASLTAHSIAELRTGDQAHRALITLAASLLLAAPVAPPLIAVVPQASGALQRIATSDAFNRVASIQIGHVDVGAQIAKAGESAVVWGSQHVISLAGSATRALLNLTLALVGLYYLLIGGPAAWTAIRKIHSLFGRRRRHASGTVLIPVTRATLLGIAASAASQGSIVGLGFWVVGLPDPVLRGAVTAGVSILPILGSSIVWAPATIVLAVEGRLGAAITLGLIGFVVASNIDNLVRPLVYRRVSGFTRC